MGWSGWKEVCGDEGKDDDKESKGSKKSGLRESGCGERNSEKM